VVLVFYQYCSLVCTESSMGY